MQGDNDKLVQELEILRREMAELESRYQQSLNELDAFRYLTTNISDVIWTFDPVNYRMLTISPSVQKVLGYTHVEYINLTIDDILSESSIKLIQAITPPRYSDFIQTKNIRNYTDNMTLIHKDGSEVSAELVSFFHRNANTNQIEVVGITRDVSKRKKAEAKLMESEERFRYLMKQSPLAILICNTDGSINHLNDAYIKLWGFNKNNLNELLQKFNILHDKQVAELGLTPFVQRAMQGEIIKLPSVYYDAAITSDELEFKSPLNVKRWVECYFYPIKNNEGEITNVVMFEENITERKLAEIQLKDSEAKYRSIFETSANGIVLINEEKKIVDCNSSFCSIFGFDKDELINQSYKSFLLNEGNEWDMFFDQASNKPFTSNVFEIDAQKKDGTIVPVEMNTSKIMIDGKPFCLGNMKDLTEQKNVDKRIYSTMVKSEEKERERYAKELHDGLGPLLSTGLIYVDTIFNESDNEQLKEYAQRAHSILIDSTNTVKEISNNLSPVILNEYGITQAIRSFIEKIKNATHINFSITDTLTQRFPEIIEFTIYRTLVELVNNAIKYSNAKHVKIGFSMKHQLLEVTYSDDGVGFDLLKIKDANQGFGLLNLENRIRKISGKYKYRTAPGKGVEVKIKLKTKGI
ncbi:PAS domain S-box protein [Carboxylicivirga marina]|uniref:histidine kinase n=1 Tax=Carboxylicivirga marina TaxID=2800988 RepID=A0ABS1HN07_9BACT|nr:PAS domain S-box protein [Carboxylicivirga marina]MBK3518981.1 PAS domain S-box protein [Carboxylicivirga marina]